VSPMGFESRVRMLVLVLVIVRDRTMMRVRMLAQRLSHQFLN